MGFDSYLMSKTQYAFMFTCEEFFRVNPHVYFWTFTFKNVPSCDEAAMLDWDSFSKRLSYWYPESWGVRVTELHKSHGIHFHFFLNRRIAIDQMRKIVFGTGNTNGRNRYLDFGRLSVAKCDKSPQSIAYLTLYLTKKYRLDNWFGHRRRWGCMGGFTPSRCRDVVYESVATENRKKLFGGIRCGYTALMMTTHFSDVWGCLENWPAESRALVLGQPGVNGGSLVKQWKYYEEIKSEESVGVNESSDAVVPGWVCGSVVSDRIVRDCNGSAWPYGGSVSGLAKIRDGRVAVLGGGDCDVHDRVGVMCINNDGNVTNRDVLNEI